MQKQLTPIFLMIILLLFACSRDNVPVVTEWIGVRTKDGQPVDKVFKTGGKGEGPVSWWVGGYTWPGGYFIVELTDVKKEQTLIRKVYQYGDKATGNDELPRFKWWHSEEIERINLNANRVYKIQIRGKGLAQPGAGFGLWLYKIGEEEPKRRGGWQGIQ